MYALVYLFCIFFQAVVINLIGFGLFGFTNAALVFVLIVGSIWSFLDVYVFGLSKKISGI